MKVFLFISISSLLIASCHRVANNEQPKESTAKVVIENPIIQKIAEISFRRSYADHHLLTEIQMDSLYKTNPSLMTFDENEKNSVLFQNLEKVKILEKDGLLVERFEKDSLEVEYYIDSQKKWLFSYTLLENNSLSIKVSIQNKNKIVDSLIEINDSFLVGIVLEDIDNDNIKEMLILVTYYIMNGDNYDLIILKFVE
jgi:hypothetical protein